MANPVESHTQRSRALGAMMHFLLLPHQKKKKSLTRLELQVRCSGQLLTHMLNLLPALEILHLRLASPCALNEAFFWAFIATKSNADSPGGKSGLPSLPLCLKLVELEVNYKRWLRGPERTALLQIFDGIVSSRASKSFYLILNVLAQRWFVWSHVESIHEVAGAKASVIGISSPQGIIPLSIHAFDPLTEVPFREAEYLVAVQRLSVECLSNLHHLVELRVGDNDNVLPSGPPPTLPLFHTLRVLEAENIDPSFLAGQTFHRLERCRMSSFYGKRPKLSQD